MSILLLYFEAQIVSDLVSGDLSGLALVLSLTKFTTLTILNVQFTGIKYIHVVVQPSPVSISRPFHHPRLKLCAHQTAFIFLFPSYC
jgi:hypothetical protein